MARPLGTDGAPAAWTPEIIVLVDATAPPRKLTNWVLICCRLLPFSPDTALLLLLWSWLTHVVMVPHTSIAPCVRPALAAVAGRNRAAHGHVEARRFPACLAPEPTQRGHGPGDRLERVVHPHPPIAHPGRPAQGGARFAADVERRPWTLH